MQLHEKSHGGNLTGRLKEVPVVCLKGGRLYKYDWKTSAITLFLLKLGFF